MPEIARHKTAIKRRDFSLPVKCLFRDRLLGVESSFFDYGCGYGENIERLREDGFQCEGWDPAFRPNHDRIASDVINLGYVINVIEEPQERSETLRAAWNLTKKILVVSAQIRITGRGNNHIEFGDGVVTRLGTFQKFYTQAELRKYIQSELDADALPAAPGVFYVFKDESLQQQYLANRYRRQSAPRKRIAEIRFDEHRELLESFMECLMDLGRIPELDEFSCSNELIEKFGSVKRALSLVRRVAGLPDWDDVRQTRIEDLLVYLALSRFRRRPSLRNLPRSLQRDIKAFFGSYKKACGDADELLFQAGDADLIDEACKHSKLGKLLPNALYIHRDAVGQLEPLLRIYEGCARAFIGEVEDANIFKIHRFSGKVSYLSYPDFERKPHPALVRSVKVNLRSLDLNCYDYSSSVNPPILHRKETFLSDEHPQREKFARLTRQEERNGLLNDSRSIGTQNGWQLRLQESGFVLKGHRLLRAKSSA